MNTDDLLIFSGKGPDKKIVPMPPDPSYNATLRNAKILYASLDDQPRRREAIERNISGRAPIAFVECVDGRLWTEAETNAYLSDELLQVREESKKAGKTWFASGAVACALTHRDHLIGESYPVGKVLCEDDAIFKRDFIKLIAIGEVAEKLGALDGVTLLNYRSRQPIKAEKNPIASIGRYTIHRLASDHIASAAAYFVPECISKSIQHGQTPLRWPVDAWVSFRDCGLYEDVFVVYPAPARVGDFPSTINYGRSSRNKLVEKLRQSILLRRLRWWITDLSGKSNVKINDWV